ncbi:MAG: ABC transporter permease [Anaerostipes sp.]|nr:ABC transporter permease [Anaerostipes sp.]
MSLNTNNNSRIIYSMAKNNLMANKMSSLFSTLSILLAITLVSTISLFIIGMQTAETQVLENMQHVMYMDVTKEQIQSLASDERTELCIPYKHSEKERKIDGVKYNLYYSNRSEERIRTYVLAKGKEPEKYDEIAVDKAFINALGKEYSLGVSINLNIDGTTEKFTICGYTNDEYSTLTYPVRVSKAFAEQSLEMKDLPYTALVRIIEAEDMSVSTFTTAVYQLAMDYGIERQNVNINGKFEQSLQDGNSSAYTILFVSILLFIASGIVIYSVFYLSVTSRVQQIGQLQTIGMTEKQVKKMIRREGLLLSLFTIPIGLVVSGIVSFLLHADGWTLKNFGIVAFIVSIFGILIVQISIGKPASIASKISPIEASRSVSVSKKERAGTGEHRKLTPYTLARMENKNNRKRWWFTTVSLALGGIIFMVATTWISSWDKEAYSRQDKFQNSEYYISYLYDHSSPKTYGITEMQLTGHLGSELIENIRKIPYVKNGQVENEVAGNIEYQGATFLQSFYPLTLDDIEYEQISADGNNSYEYMAENDAILITNSDFSESVNGITFEPGDKIKFRYFDGKEQTIELEIAAVSSKMVESDSSRPTFCMTDKTIRKLWKIMNTASAFSISVEDYEKNGNQVEEEIRTLLNDYEDLSFWTLREQRIEDSGQIQKLQVQIYGISIFIILFSIFNLINTVISSITSRKQELSMLESIGMEERQVRNMLFGESILLALPNILITLTLGTGLGFGFIYFMKNSAKYLEYQFPVVAAILYIIGMIGIPMLISFCCLKRQNKDSLVDRIKN